MDDYTTRNYDDSGSRNLDDSGRSLYYLDELSDYKVESDYSDVRGWDVYDKDSRRIGKVSDLVVNKNTEQVVYLDIELDEELISEGRRIRELSDSSDVKTFVNEEGEDHLIIPIGMILIDDENKKVFTNEIGYGKFLRNKWIRRGTMINRDYEFTTFQNYFPDGTIDRGQRDDRFYDRKEFFRRRRL